MPVAHNAFQAISDPTRREILDLLKAGGPMRAGDLAERFPKISRPAVSKHLRVLRSSSLVRQRKDGREIWYRLNPHPLSQVQGWLEEYQEFWSGKLHDLKEASES